MLLATGLSPYQGVDRQTIPNISLSKYLLDLKFEGVFIGEVSSSRKTPPKTKSSTNVQGQKAKLKFYPGKQKDRGIYDLTIGSQLITGEWSISEEWIHLWIDKVDRVKADKVSELAFRAPRFVDDGWIARGFPSEESTFLKGKLIMANVPDQKYHMRTNRGRLSPSRTEIVIHQQSP